MQWTMPSPVLTSHLPIVDFGAMAAAQANDPDEHNWFLSLWQREQPCCATCPQESNEMTPNFRHPPCTLTSRHPSYTASCDSARHQHRRATLARSCTQCRRAKVDQYPRLPLGQLSCHFVHLWLILSHEHTLLVRIINLIGRRLRSSLKIMLWADFAMQLLAMVEAGPQWFSRQAEVDMNLCMWLQSSSSWRRSLCLYICYKC